MNFSYGVIAAVGVLIAISLGLIAADPGYLAEPSGIQADDAAEPQMPDGMSASSTISMAVGSSVPGCEVDDECFIPFHVLAGVGDTITWNNDDAAAHTVTSGTVDAGHDDIFDSGLFAPGDIFEFTFNDAGEYDYFCLVHPWMIGKVTVS